jgi:hypothetical protein
MAELQSYAWSRTKDRSTTSFLGNWLVVTSAFCFCHQVELVDGVIRLDNWINLNINPADAAAIIALRPAIESLIVRATKDPESLSDQNPLDTKVICNHQGIFQDCFTPLLICGNQTTAKLDSCGLCRRMPIPRRVSLTSLILWELVHSKWFCVP